MGKTEESLLQRNRNNARVDPATLSHYLCYYCGKTSSDRLEYQLHMLQVHEVMSQSYQLWSDHTMDTLNLRWSESKGHNDRESSRSLSASPRSRQSKKNSEEDDEDYVYEDEKSAKRQKKDDERSKMSAAETHKKLIENQRKKSEVAAEKRREKARKDEEKRKMDEAKKVFQQQTNALQQKGKTAVARRMSNVEKGEVFEIPKEIKVEVTEKKKRRKTECSRWREIQSEGDKPEVTALVKKILEESKRKETSSQEVGEADLTPEISNRKHFDYNEHVTKYCKVCKKGTHYTFASLFEHYQDHHHAVIKSFHYYGYNGRILVGKKNLLERDYCQRCVIKFPRARDYYSHMIRHHIYESVRCQLDFESATNADVEAQMTFRDRVITLGYNFPFEVVDSDVINVKPVKNNRRSSTSSRKSKSKDQPSTSAVKVEEPDYTEPPELLPVTAIKLEIP